MKARGVISLSMLLLATTIPTVGTSAMEPTMSKRVPTIDVLLTHFEEVIMAHPQDAKLGRAIVDFTQALLAASKAAELGKALAPSNIGQIRQLQWLGLAAESGIDLNVIIAMEHPFEEFLLKNDYVRKAHEHGLLTKDPNGVPYITVNGIPMSWEEFSQSQYLDANGIIKGLAFDQAAGGLVAMNSPPPRETKTLEQAKLALQSAMEPYLQD